MIPTTKHGLNALTCISALQKTILATMWGQIDVLSARVRPASRIRTSRRRAASHRTCARDSACRCSSCERRPTA